MTGVRAQEVPTGSVPTELRLTGVPDAPRVGRRFAAARAVALGHAGLADAVELLVSELVTNAILHTPGVLRLAVSAEDGDLLLCVFDSSPVLPRARPHSLRAGTGRGLQLMAAAEERVASALVRDLDSEWAL